MSQPLPSSLRMTQRAPTSCSFCYRRKIKCSKTFPCDNCVKRGAGDSCSREPVVVRGKIVSSDHPPTPLSPDQLRTLTETQLRTEIANLKKKLSEQDRTIAGLNNQINSEQHQNPAAGLPNVVMSTSTPRNAGNLPSSDILQPYLAELKLPLGPAASGNPVPATTRKRSRASAGFEEPFLQYPEPTIAPSIPPPHVRPILSLVPVEQSLTIVHLTLKYTDWIHSVVHVPTYMQEHQVFLEHMRRGQTSLITDEYLAVYFAIISCGLWFLQDNIGNRVGFNVEDTRRLPTIWFEACLEALNKSDFLSRPTLESLQAICILPMISHNCGATAYVDSLLHCGLRIAQFLKLHLLGAETEESVKHGLIGREIGRRIWALLCIAETHQDESIPFPLFLPKAVTVLPANVYDEELIEGQPLPNRPLNEPSLMTQILVVHSRAEVFRHFSKRYFACVSVEEQFDLIVETEIKLGRTLELFPCIKPTPDPYPTSIDNDPSKDNEPFDFLSMLRSNWAVIIPSTRMILYRSFLGKAYKIPKYGKVRSICVEASRKVLEERKRPMPALYHRPWFISAYTVLAGVVLATELLHGQGSPEEKAALQSDLRGIISVLPLAGAENKVVQRGVSVLEKILQDYNEVNQEKFEGKEIKMRDVETLWPGSDQISPQWKPRATLSPSPRKLAHEELSTSLRDTFTPPATMSDSTGMMSSLGMESAGMNSMYSDNVIPGLTLLMAPSSGLTDIWSATLTKATVENESDMYSASGDRWWVP